METKEGDKVEGTRAWRCQWRPVGVQEEGQRVSGKYKESYTDEHGNMAVGDLSPARRTPARVLQLSLRAPNAKLIPARDCPPNRTCIPGHVSAFVL